VEQTSRKNDAGFKIGRTVRLKLVDGRDTLPRPHFAKFQIGTRASYWQKSSAALRKEQ
jgi:hypothetical protein